MFDYNKSGLHFKFYSIYLDTEDGKFKSHLSKFDHVTMYSMFALSGIIDLLALFIRYPKHTPQIFLTLAFFVTSFLMHWHSHDNEANLASVVHLLFFYCTFISTIFSGLRLLSATNLLINTGFSLTVILQGTWFIQTGYVLYGATEWDRNYSGNMEFMIPVFVWHIAIILVSALVIYTVLMVIIRRAKKYDRARVGVDTEHDQLLNEEESSMIMLSEVSDKSSSESAI